MTDLERKKITVHFSPEEFTLGKMKMAQSGKTWQSLLHQLFTDWLNADKPRGTLTMVEIEDALEGMGLKPGDTHLVRQVVESIRDKRNTHMLTALRSLVAAMAAEPYTPEPRRAAAPAEAPDAEPETT